MSSTGPLSRWPERTHTLPPESAELEEAAAALRVIASPDEAQLGATLRVDAQLSVGREPGPDVDVVIRDHHISRRHASVRRIDDDRFELVDHGSKNGTRLQARRVRLHPLIDGALIRLGATLLRFERAARLAPPVALPAEVVALSPAMAEAAAALRLAAANARSVVVRGPRGSGRRHLTRVLDRPRPVDIDAATATLSAPDAAACPLDASSLDAALAAAPLSVLLHAPRRLPAALRDRLLTWLEASPDRPARIITISDAPLEGRLAPLAAAEVTMPPLSARQADIPTLARRLAAHPDAPHAARLSPACLEALTLAAWPGDVSELSEVVREATRPGRALRLSALPARLREARARAYDATVWPRALLFDGPPGTLRDPDGQPIDVTHRSRLTLALDALLTQRQRDPAAPISKDDLIAAVWPDESIQHTAALNRLYKTISELRTSGLRDALYSVEGGYTLAPSQPVRVLA